MNNAGTGMTSTNFAKAIEVAVLLAQNFTLD